MSIAHLEYDEKDFRDMLIAGAAATGNAARGACHLILTAVPELRHWFDTGIIQISTRPNPDGPPQKAAFVANWQKLRDAGGGSYGHLGSETKLLRIADSLSRNSINNLAELTEGLTPQHARAVAEAMLIASGFAGWFEITPTPACPPGALPDATACGGCGVQLGEPHDPSCDIAKCQVTGGQRMLCKTFGGNPIMGMAALITGGTEDDFEKTPVGHDCGTHIWDGSR